MDSLNPQHDYDTQDPAGTPLFNRGGTFAIRRPARPMREKGQCWIKDVK